MKISRVALVGAACFLGLSLAGCENGQMTNRDVGMLTGGVVGGILGSQIHGDGRTTAIIGGTLLGGYLGGQVGKSMDEDSRRRLASTLEYTRTNQATHWVDPDTGQAYTVVPVKTYRQGGRVCRRFRATVVIRGRSEQAVGTACRQSDGVWEIVNSSSPDK